MIIPRIPRAPILNTLLVLNISESEMIESASFTFIFIFNIRIIPKKDKAVAIIKIDSIPR